jgi:hypothetical protein
MTTHPQGKPTGIVVGATERMPILGRLKTFHSWNETTVCTVETRDRSGATRGAIAIGFSNHGRSDGVTTYSTIEEAEAVVVLLQNAIDDARRIERGEAPLAQEGNPRRDN